MAHNVFDRKTEADRQIIGGTAVDAREMEGLLDRTPLKTKICRSGVDPCSAQGWQ